MPTVAKITNQEIAKILYEIGEYFEIKGIPFKPRAYEKAAYFVENLEEEVFEVYKRGGLKAVEDISGVGISIAEKIEELIKTGHLKYHQMLKKSLPVNISELSRVEGVGPKAIFRLYKKLKVRNIGDLEKAAKTGKIAKIAGFGSKTEQKILKGIEFLKKSGGRFLLGDVLPLARIIEGRLKNLKSAGHVTITGSIRRMQETIGDIDILVTIQGSQPAFAKALASPKPTAKRGSAGKIMDFFVSMPEVSHVYSQGETKTLVRFKNGMDADIEVVPSKSYGAAILAFTGDKRHNIALRALAGSEGYKLNDFGLWRGKKMIAGQTEEEIYKALKMETPPPEIRKDSGEIQVALKNKLPKLIGYNEIKGDLQVQTNWTDGENSIEEMAEAASDAGLEYIAITDHTKSLAMTGGSDEKKLLKQMAEIDKIQSRIGGTKIKILKGAEVNILKDGSLDIEDTVLAKLDVVGIAVHSHFNLSRAEQTKRIIKAMQNKHADILFHPTGRLIQKREPYDVDVEEIIKVAKSTGTVLEIDADPNRLDLKDEYIRKAVEAGVKLAIDTDAHSKNSFHYLEYGIAQARRGWAKSSDIINTRPWKEMLKLLKH
ncbi:MAG: DNA polymerase/3'-5' exonuclease PolX [Candidatus Azambacteria bacterium]|nr:DNA polymerase/3'-5' exonuclease PolX [Candidatus Azambacteria bacterium]